MTLISLALAVGLLATTATAKPVSKSDTLAKLASQQKGRYFGTAVSASYIGDYPPYKQILDTQFNAITPENEMKWEVIEPERGVFNWTGADIVSGMTPVRY
jgi:endo-1,4-beta-xylanase